MASDIHTVHAADVPAQELDELDDMLADLTNVGVIDEDGPLYVALGHIIDTLRDGRDIHIITLG